LDPVNRSIAGAPECAALPAADVVRGVMQMLDDLE